MPITIETSVEDATVCLDYRLVPRLKEAIEAGQAIPWHRGGAVALIPNGVLKNALEVYKAKARLAESGHAMLAVSLGDADCIHWSQARVTTQSGSVPPSLPQRRRMRKPQ